MKSVAGKQAFFLYFAPYAVHAPFEAPPELIPEGKHAMVGMMKSLDMAIGRILDTLDELGERENTLVVFLSDNGGVPKVFEHGFSNAPFRGGKATVLDGGIHVPLLGIGQVKLKEENIRKLYRAWIYFQVLLKPQEFPCQRVGSLMA